MLWLALVLVLIVSIAVLAYPLLRPTTAAVVGDDTRMRTNVQIYRQRLAELDDELASGKIQAEGHAQLVAELKRNLLDSAQEHTRKTGLGQNQLWVVGCIGVIVPLASIMLYFQLSPQTELEEWHALRATIVPEVKKLIDDPESYQSDEDIQMRDFLRVMQHYLHVEGGSAEGWGIYANIMGGFDTTKPQATTAARKAYKYDPDNRLNALRFAQFELESNHGKMTPRAERVLRKLAVRYPDDPNVLMLKGKGFFAAERWADAIDAWQPLLKMIERTPAGNPQRDEIINAMKRNIAVARSRLNAVARKAHAQAGLGPIAATQGEAASANAGDDTTSSAGAQVTVEVSGDPALLASAPPEAKLFVFAKAESGSPMPLAVKKMRPTQWPVRVTLTSEDAMMPANTLNDHKAVQITARWSASGQIAMGSEGSIVGSSSIVNPFDRPTVQLSLSSSGQSEAETGAGAADTADANAVDRNTESVSTAANAAGSEASVAQGQGGDADRAPAGEKASGASQITVSVSGQKDLLETASASARLFVFAKAVGGPPMPLAVKRVRPDAWPVTLTLTEGDAMMPTSTLAQYDSVIVSALWSETGQIPMGNAGQQRAESDVVNPTEKPSVALSLP